MHVLRALDFGGVERQMELIAEARHNSEMEHRFVAIASGGRSAIRISDVGAKVKCLNVRADIPSFQAYLALSRLFRVERPTVVHAHGAEANFHALIAAYTSGVPVRIGEEIGIPTHSRTARTVFRFVYRTAHTVVGVSEAVRQWLIQSGEVPVWKARRIYNPVKLAEERELGAEQGPFRIGFLGRLEAVKNPLALVEATHRLVTSGEACELWIIGDGSQRELLANYIHMHALSDKIKLCGYAAEPAQLLASCDLYVQPSISEGFGLALVEAMGLGLPVIATAVGGAPEIIQHGHTGWLVSEATSTELYAAIRRAMHLPRSELRLVGSNARGAVLGRFDPSGYLSEIEAVYKEVAA